jgi:hypothetical protein
VVLVSPLPAEPEHNASTVFTFGVHPRGPEASIVQVLATFNSPVKVPLHPATDVDCVSYGIQESNLFRQVLAQATQTHRPTFGNPATSNPPSSPPLNHPPGKSTIERPAESAAPPPPAMSGFSIGATRPTLEHRNLPDLPAPPTP